MVGSNLYSISMQTRSRHLGTCCIRLPQPGQDGERNENGRGHSNLPYWKPQAAFSCLEPDSDTLFSFILFNPIGSKNMLLKDTTWDHWETKNFSRSPSSGAQVGRAIQMLGIDGEGGFPSSIEAWFGGTL